MMMNIYSGFAVSSLIVCLVSLLYHVIRLIRYGNPEDFSKKTGRTAPAIGYSFTGAMNPVKKESAYLHLPTYTAGLLYHLGTFLSLVIFFLLLFGIVPSGILRWSIAGFLLVSGISGLAVLVKRMIKKELRSLSHPDDYISNALVTWLHFMTLSTLFYLALLPVYFILTGILFLYLPLGKLRHTVYFFAARYHLGFFYGWRGVWPPK